jgi:hypothetical protein
MNWILHSGKYEEGYQKENVNGLGYIYSFLEVTCEEKLLLFLTG